MMAVIAVLRRARSCSGISCGRRYTDDKVPHGHDPLSWFGDFSSTNTGRTDSNALAGAVNHGSHPAQIRIPPPPRQVVSMTHAVPINRAFVTDFAARHEGNLPCEINGKYSIQALIHRRSMC